MKRFLLILTIFILLAGIPILVFYVKKEQDLRSKATPATTLSFQPSLTTKNVGETFSANVIIDTGTNNVYLASLRITFDPNAVSVESIGPGTALPRILVEGDSDPADYPPGNATITLQSEYNAEPFNGQGTLAVIQFRTLAPTTGQTQIAFHEETTIVPDENEPEINVLESSTPLRLTVNGSIAPTATPTPISEDDLRLTDDEDASSAADINETENSSAEENVVILFPTSDSGIVDAQPEFTGTAPPNSTVTITIYSSPKTAVVYADSTGNWNYTPDEALEPGPHDLVVTAQAADGSSISATESFVVAGGTGENVESEGGVPVAGSYSATLNIILSGIMLLALGLYLNRRNTRI